jgi:basic amino acid/polyamine antiporter, APA family
VSADSSGFRREIGPFDATMLVMGTMIGSGIFIVSSDIAATVGSSGWLLAVWVLTGVMTILGALCYAELAGMMPEAGGQYVYLKRAYSPVWGFLYGWTLFMVIQTGSIAAVAVAFTKFLGVFAPALGTDVKIPTGESRSPATVVYRSPDDYQLKVSMRLPSIDVQSRNVETTADGKIVDAPAKPAPEAFTILQRDKNSPFTISIGQFLAAAIVVALTLWNCLGVKEGTWMQNVFTEAKTLGLLMVIVIGLFVAFNPEIVKANATNAFNGINATDSYQSTAGLFPGVSAWMLMAMVVGGAMVGSLFSADAWNNITFAGGEVKNPRRTLPLALSLGVFLVIALYLLANLAYLAVLPAVGKPDSQITPGAETEVLERGISNARDGRVATAVMEQAAKGWGQYRNWAAGIMAVVVMISTFGCLNGMILMGARLYYAMAKDNLFFGSAGRLNARGVPAVALILQGIWSAVLIFTGTYNELLDYVIFAALLFYAITVIGLFVLRRSEPDAPRTYRVTGYPVLPALYVVLCGLVMIDLLIVKPNYTWPGLLIVLAGLPVYVLWRMFGGRREAAA